MRLIAAAIAAIALFAGAALLEAGDPMRIRADYVFGSTDTALTDTDTTLSSSGLAGLPAVASPDVAALTLYDGTNYEVVHVTSHADSATSATILRGQEGSAAQAWPSGATWHLGPTAADLHDRTTLRDLTTGHRFLIAAHRGDIGSDDSYPENSLEAVRQAAHKGVDFVEIDLWQSADGTFWLNHDATVDRTTGGTGTVTAMTDAALAALNYDAGYGYDAGRHGSTVGLTTLAEVMAALEPYGCGLFAQFLGGDVSDLAGQFVAAGWASRVVIEVGSLAEAAEVKAVDSSLATMAHVTNVAGATASDAVDWLSQDVDAMTTLADTQAYAPRVVKAYTSIADFGADEGGRFDTAYGFGARAFQAHDIEMALERRSGGVRSVTAGAGVSVDNTDPANPVISAAASSGLPLGHPDIPPGSPSADDDEFEATLSGWTTLGSPTTLDANSTVAGHLYIKPAIVSGDNAVGAYKAAPSVPFTVTAKLSDAALIENYNRAGLFIGAATPGAMHSAAIGWTNGTTPRISAMQLKATSPTSSFTNGSATEQQALGSGAMPAYLRIVVSSATSVTYQYSAGGLVWRTLLAADNPGFTIGSVGLWSYSNNATRGGEAAFDWIRFQ